MNKELNYYLKEFYPYLWEQYKFLYMKSVTEINEKFNFLLVFNTLLVIIYFELFGEFAKTNYLFFIPLVFLTIPIFLYFLHITPERIWFPWFEKENWRDYQLSKINVYEKLWEDVLGAVPHIVIQPKRKPKDILYRISAHSITLGFFSSFAIFLFVFYNSFVSSMIIFLISIIFIALIETKLYNKERISHNPAKEIKEFMDCWRDGKNKRKN